VSASIEQHAHLLGHQGRSSLMSESGIISMRNAAASDRCAGPRRMSRPTMGDERLGGVAHLMLQIAMQCALRSCVRKTPGHLRCWAAILAVDLRTI